MHAETPFRALPGEVMTEGVVVRVLVETNQLIVHHRPIDEWQMAEMQMKFDLAEGLSAGSFQAGQVLRFSLRQDSMSRFTITQILQ